tara:strand:+ start:22500 stop:24320 length:1821 start_codon:yes stop_codon:yes gene_type:complete
MARKIPYFARNFADIRGELVNYVRQYYPEIFNDFNDASVGMMLLELNAAVGDMLSYQTDRMFQETQIDYAQERSSLLSLARTFGLKVPGRRPSVTIVDFSVIVPVNGDSFDLSYAPIIRRGAQVSGAGKVFETINDVDFSSPFTVGGIPNRIIIPNIDGSGLIVNYTLTKREMVINGITKTFKRVISTNDVRPFFELVLPDNDVISINSIITLEGTNFTITPNIDQFLDEELRWFEMDALAEDKIFIPDDSIASDNSSVQVGRWLRVNKRFIREYTDLGFTKIIFGGGSQDIGSLCDFDVDNALVGRIGDFINNLSLGQTLEPSSTMFISYRVGGGSATNIGPNVITTVNNVSMFINGNNPSVNGSVQASLRVNNPLPALGGKDEPSITELRNLIRYNFASQNRAVTLKDYKSRIALMPGEFGVPFRSGIIEQQNKISVYVLSLGSDGSLTNQSTSTLRRNIANYLADYRMINDYVEINNGKIINVSFEVGLYIDKQFAESQIMSEVIGKIREYFDINKWDMGENIYMSPLIEVINNVGGVLNVMELKVFNKVGNGYSLNESPQPLLVDQTRELDLSNNYALIGDPISMFEIKNPSVDIRIRVKNN